MNKQIFLRRMLWCAVLLLSVTLFTACGGDDVPNWESFFSEDEIKSWEKEEKEYSYTMHGGYFISFQGELYPVDFENGKINWLKEPPKEMIFVKMCELFTDASLKKRCAYLGSFREERIFGDDIFEEGFILDGKRPSYGSVLYMDETKTRNTFFRYGKTPVYGMDDEIVIIRSYDGQRAEYVFYIGDVVLSDDKGVFLEEFNTPRKIFQYAIENNIPFDAYTEYTNLSYPSSLMLVYDNTDAENYDLAADLTIDVENLELADEYHVSMFYMNEKYPDFNCIVFVDAEAIQDFYAAVHYAIAYPNEGAYRDIVMDEQGKVTQCWYKYFYGASGGKDNSAQVSKIFYSLEEFNRFLEEQSIIDHETQTSLYFSKEENGEVFDGYLEYDSNQFPWSTLRLYGVWNAYHVVNLHAADETTEGIVCTGKDLRLPFAMRPGYAFEGWYADESCSGQPVTSVSYEDGYTDLYAKFREVDSYTLTFEPYDGKTLDAMEYVFGDEVALPYLSRPFYIFEGWYTDPECKGEPHKTISTEFYGSFHLYPGFAPQEYTVTLNAGENVIWATVRYDENYILPTYITRGGFIGYFDENGVQYTDENGKSLVPFTDGADIQLFAKYKEG